MRKPLAVLLPILFTVIPVAPAVAGPVVPDRPASADVAGALAGTVAKVPLRLHLVEGKSYTLRTVTDQKISQTVRGERHDTIQTMEIGFLCSVTRVDPAGTATLKMVHRSVFFRQKGPEGTVEYDSARPPQTIPAPARAYAVLVGEGFSLDLTAAGQVTAIRGAAAMMEKVIQRLDLPEGPLKSSVADGMRSRYGDQTLKESMEKQMAIYPDHPVGVGDSWTRQVAFLRGLPRVETTTWTLRERRDGVATIDSVSTIDPNPQAAPLVMGPVKVAYMLTGRQRGTVEMQESTGWVMHSSSNLDLAGHTTISGTPGQPEETAVPMSIKSVINFNSEEADAEATPAAPAG